MRYTTYWSNGFYRSNNHTFYLRSYQFIKMIQSKMKNAQLQVWTHRCIYARFTDKPRHLLFIILINIPDR